MSARPTPEQIADCYAGARERVLALAADLTDDDLAKQVPGTPKWTVHDLFSHFVGCPQEMLAGHYEGAGGEEWTQAQVDARRGRPVADLLSEWQSVTDKIDAAIRAGEIPIPLTFDVLTHESDLRGAIGAEPTPDPAAIRFLIDGFGARVRSVVGKSEFTPLELRATDSDWTAGTPGGVVAEATEYEWTRALTGRRSNAQVSAYSWSGDPAPYLDLLCPFGPLPTVDVEE